MAMAKKLCFIVILSMFLLIVELSRAQEESPSPATSPERETPADSPLLPSSSPEADSFPPQALSPEAEPLGDSPPRPPPHPPQTESPLSSSPSPAPSDEDSDEDSEQETEYFPSPTPSPAPEEGKPDDIKASEDGDEFEQEGDEEDSGMSGLKKAGIAIGAILGVGAIVIGALVYKKRQDNLTRARYTYFNQGEFL